MLHRTREFSVRMAALFFAGTASVDVAVRSCPGASVRPTGKDKLSATSRRSNGCRIRKHTGSMADSSTPLNNLIEFEVLTNQPGGVGGMSFNNARHREIHIELVMLNERTFDSWRRGHRSVLLSIGGRRSWMLRIRTQALRKHDSNNSIAFRANSHMLASRSALPVSRVITASTGPQTAMHEWPAHPVRFPLGPLAPVSLKPQVAPSLFDAACEQLRIRLAGRTHVGHILRGHAEQRRSARERVDHGPSKIVTDAPGTATSAALINPPPDDSATARAGSILQESAYRTAERS